MLKFGVTFDCTNPDVLAQFWAEVLGYKRASPPPGFATWEDWLRAVNVPEDQWGQATSIVDPENQRPRMFFQKVPEGKTAKNRMHLDIDTGLPREMPREERRQALREKAVALQALGATKVQEGDDFGSLWIVMQDPEGNEFCIA